MTIIQVTCTVTLELEVDGACPENISEILRENIPNHLTDGAFVNSAIVDVIDYIIFLNKMDVTDLTVSKDND